MTEIPPTAAGPQVIDPPESPTADARPHHGEAPVGVATIGHSLSANRNSLNFLRLVLALAVVLSHSITLGLFGSEWILGKTTLGTVAVYGFFGISGYLIAGSADRNNVGRYLWQRFLRIFPAFWMCLFVTAFVFGTIAWFHVNPGLSRTCGLRCYLTEPGGPFGYVAKNFWLQINQGNIAGTLPNGWDSFGWNAQLWTLVMEFLCYLLLAVFSVLGLLKRRPLVALIAAIAWITEIMITSIPTLAQNFSFPLFDKWAIIKVLFFTLQTTDILALVTIFLSGSLIYLYREKLPDSGAIAIGAAVLVLTGLVIPVGLRGSLNSMALTAVFLAYPMIWLGIHLPFPKVGAVNDYSYGVYIYAFPIQQLLVLWGLNKWGYVPYTVLSVAVIIPFAVGSWWLIEKHALKLKKMKVRRPFRLDSS